MTIEVPQHVVELHRCLLIKEDELKIAQRAFAKEARWWVENGGTPTELGEFLIKGAEKVDGRYFVKE